MFFILNCEGRDHDLKQDTLNKISCIVSNTCLFRKVYIITLFFEMVAFLDIIALALKCVILFWGSFIFIKNFIFTKRVFKVKYSFWIWGFIAVGIITSIYNISKDLPANLVFVYHSMICFFIFYGMYTEEKHDKIEKEMVFLLKAFAILSTVFSMISLILLVVKAQVNIGPYHLGIFRNRLIGVYTNQNLLAFSMVVSIISLDILRDDFITDKYKNSRLPNWFMILSAFINFLSLFLSDSNASFIFIIIYFTVRIFYKSLSKYSSIGIRQFIREGASLLVCCATIISGSFIARRTCQDMINALLNDVHNIENTVTDDNPGFVPNPSPLSNYMTDTVIGRENYDVSSGRLTLFKQGVELFKHSPAFGIGRGNLVAYGNKYIDGGLIFSDLHNSYLTILVSYGIVGFAFFLIFAVLVALSICKYIIRSSYIPSSEVFSKLFSGLIAYCAYGIFEKAILSEITFMVVFFWLILGYAVSYKEYEEKIYDLDNVDNYDIY